MQRAHTQERPYYPLITNSCMKYLIVLICIIVYIFFGNELGFAIGTPWYTHFTYIFQHASVWHLVINSLAFIGFYTQLEKINNYPSLRGGTTKQPTTHYPLPTSLLIAFLASFVSMYKLPTVGLSGVVYAMIGIYIGQTLTDANIKIANTRRYMLFLLAVGLSLTISLFTHNSNIILHIVCLVIGLVVACVRGIEGVVGSE